MDNNPNNLSNAPEKNIEESLQASLEIIEREIRKQREDLRKEIEKQEKEAREEEEQIIKNLLSKDDVFKQKQFKTVTKDPISKEVRKQLTQTNVQPTEEDLNNFEDEFLKIGIIKSLPEHQNTNILDDYKLELYNQQKIKALQTIENKKYNLNNEEYLEIYKSIHNYVDEQSEYFNNASCFTLFRDKKSLQLSNPIKDCHIKYNGAFGVPAPSNLYDAETFELHDRIINVRRPKQNNQYPIRVDKISERLLGKKRRSDTVNGYYSGEFEKNPKAIKITFRPLLFKPKPTNDERPFILSESERKKYIMKRSRHEKRPIEIDHPRYRETKKNQEENGYGELGIELHQQAQYGATAVAPILTFIKEATHELFTCLMLTLEYNEQIENVIEATSQEPGDFMYPDYLQSYPNLYVNEALIERVNLIISHLVSFTELVKFYHPDSNIQDIIVKSLDYILSLKSKKAYPSAYKINKPIDIVELTSIQHKTSPHIKKLSDIIKTVRNERPAITFRPKQLDHTIFEDDYFAQANRNEVINLDDDIDSVSSRPKRCNELQTYAYRQAIDHDDILPSIDFNFTPASLPDFNSQMIKILNIFTLATTSLEHFNFLKEIKKFRKFFERELESKALAKKIKRDTEAKHYMFLQGKIKEEPANVFATRSRDLLNAAFNLVEENYTLDNILSFPHISNRDNRRLFKISKHIRVVIDQHMNEIRAKKLSPYNDVDIYDLMLISNIIEIILDIRGYQYTYDFNNRNIIQRDHLRGVESQIFVKKENYGLDEYEEDEEEHPAEEELVNLDQEDLPYNEQQHDDYLYDSE